MKWMCGVLMLGFGCQPGGQDGDAGPGLSNDSSAERRARAPDLPLEEYQEATAAELAASATGVRFVAVTNRRESDDYTCVIDGVAEIRRRTGRYRISKLLQNLPEDVNSAHIPDALRRFCLVEWVPNDGTSLPGSTDITAAVQHLRRRFAEYSEDLQVTSAQDASLEAVTWAQLAVAWRGQLGEIRPLPEPRLGASLTPIRIAVADTSPRSNTGEANDGRSDHGLGMGRIIKVLSCPPVNGMPGLCPGYVSHHLALPRIDGVRQPMEGGFYGYQGEIAKSIAEAVAMWMDADPAEGAARLVINLSLGWDGRYGGRIMASADELRPSVRAVYEAIEYAACRGALVIASAGNRSGGPDESEGPLFPAGWERRPSPDQATCQNRFGFPGDGGGNAGGYRPLLYAVGGVRPDDHDLGNRRPGGRPRLVAPGFQAVVGVEEGGRTVSSGINTGSSVSAAAVSGIAAALWSYRPQAGRHDLMRVIYQSAVELTPPPAEMPMVADFCLNGTCAGQTVRRVSMCAAWTQWCAGGDGACDANLMPECTTPGDYTGTLDALDGLAAALDGVVADEARPVHDLDGSDLTDLAAAPAECGYDATGGVWRIRTTDVLPAACPTHQFYLREVAPWAAPQPWGGLCPTCYGVVDASRTKVDLSLYTSSDFKTQEFYDGLITFKTDTGKLLSSVPLSDYNISSFSGGATFYLSGVPAPAGFSHIYLETLTKSGTKVTSTLDELAWW